MPSFIWTNVDTIFNRTTRNKLPRHLNRTTTILIQNINLNMSSVKWHSVSFNLYFTTAYMYLPAAPGGPERPVAPVLPVRWAEMRTLWRHQMETHSALLALGVGNSPVTGEFPSPGPVTQSFDVFFDLRLNKRLSKSSWWLETHIVLIMTSLWWINYTLFKSFLHQEYTKNDANELQWTLNLKRHAHDFALLYLVLFRLNSYWIYMWCFSGLLR